MSKRPLTKETKKKLIVGISIGAVFLLLTLFLLLFFGSNKEKALYPTLAIETPQKISLSKTEEFTLDVTVSSFGEAVYPAASMSISFDPSCLEFLGVEEGNVFITSEGSVTRKLPEWSCNPEQCNTSGLINIMYLDMTGGKNAFTKELLAEEDNVVLRLKFRLRGSARVGDIYDLIFEDAVFASSDETESLAMTTDTLKVRGAKIVFGE